MTFDNGTISIIIVAVIAVANYLASRNKATVEMVNLQRDEIKALSAEIVELRNAFEKGTNEHTRRIADKDAIIAKQDTDIVRLRTERDEATRVCAILMAKIHQAPEPPAPRSEYQAP